MTTRPSAQAPKPAREPATLLLDFTPNAVHAGIYKAVARGYDDAAGVPLEVRTPSASTDALKLLQAGRADLAILDIHDLGLARQGGADLVGVMAVVQRPLAAVLAQPRIRTPRDLEGRRAGVTGLPSDRAVLRSVVSGAGGDPGRVRETTIGFEAVKALLAGRVDAATAFWNVEGVALKREKPATREFRVDDYGAPPYPELVLCVTRKTLRERPELVRGGDPGPAAGLPRGDDRRPRAGDRGDGRRAERGARPRATRARSSRPSTPRLRAPAGAAYGRLDARDAAGVGGVGREVRDPRAPPRRRAGVRHLDPPVRADQAPGDPAARRSTSAGPSRAMRERGTTRSKPAASARRARVGVDVRVDPERARVPQLAGVAQVLGERDAVEPLRAEVEHQHVGAVRLGLVGPARQPRVVARGAQHAEHVGAQQQVVEDRENVAMAVGAGPILLRAHACGTPAAPTPAGPTSGRSRRARCAARAAPARPRSRRRRAA